MIEKMEIMKQIVPTELVVRVDDKYRVSYRRLIEFFGYEFEVFPEGGAEDAIEKVVSAMESQSYDHGASWRRVFVKECEKLDEFDICRHFVVKFRVRDAG